MKIVELKISNFKALKGERTFTLPEGLLGIVGPNGSGKSTIANAIAWCFYGPEVLPTGKTDVITWGEKEASVSIIFDLDGRRWSTRRWQGRPPLGGARIDSEAGPVAEGLSATLRAVEALLGADRVAFLASVFSRQEELSALSSLTPANRMKTVLRLLGVEELTGAIEHTKTSAREQGKNLSTLKVSLGDVNEIEQSLQKKKAAQTAINQEMDSMEIGLEEISRQSVELKDRMFDLSSRITEYNNYKISKTQANIDINNCMKSLTEILDFSGKIRLLPYRAQVDRPNTEELSVLKADLDFYSRRIADINAALKSSSAKCPVCKRPYDNKEQRLEHEQELKNEKNQLEHLVTATSFTVSYLEEEQREYAEWERYEQARLEQVAEYDNVRTGIYRIYDEYRAAQVAGNLIVPPPDVTLEIEQIQLDSQRIDQEKNDLTVELAVRRERLSSIGNDVSRIELELESQSKIAESIVALEHELKVHETTVKELSTLKEKIIASAIPAIESRASSLLSEMTAGAFTELSLSHDYDIRYRNNLGEVKEYANLSKGERDVFALALRLALSELRADRIGILFLDEVLESLDEERQELVWSALEKLTRRYNQIFVVTHVEKFRDRMPYLL